MEVVSADQELLPQTPAELRVVLTPAEEEAVVEEAALAATVQVPVEPA